MPDETESPAPEGETETAEIQVDTSRIENAQSWEELALATGGVVLLIVVLYLVQRIRKAEKKNDSP